MLKKVLITSIFMIILTSLFSVCAFAEGWPVGDNQSLNLNTSRLYRTSDGVTLDTYDIKEGDYIQVAKNAEATILGDADVVIYCDTGVNLTISNLVIDNYTQSTGPITFTGTGNTLTLVGSSTLKSKENFPGIRVGLGTELTINAELYASLTSIGGDNAAGIGACYNGKQCGTITIESGKIVAQGGEGGAGIGGANGYDDNGGHGGNITIKGGTVTATGGDFGGAGIGGGDNGGAGNITIKDGTVTATGGAYGPGIGSSRCNEAFGNITIEGGMVTAYGGAAGSAGIGGGIDAYPFISEGGNITITGGIVIADSRSNLGTGIGRGEGSINEWNISITGGEIYANGGHAHTDGKSDGALCIGKSAYTSTYDYDDVSISGSAAVFLSRQSDKYSDYITADNHVLRSDETIVVNANPPYGSAYGYSHIPADWSGTAYAYTLDTILEINDSGTHDVSTIPDTVNKININTTNAVTIKDSNKTARDIQIEVKISGVNLTIEDLNFDVSGTTDGCALAFTGAGNKLTLVGDSSLTSWGAAGTGGEPGIRVEGSTVLTIGSTSGGSVTATGGYYGAGIGGGFVSHAGDIYITGGTVHANGGNSCAGIGGGAAVTYGGDVFVSGGQVYASGNGAMDIGESSSGNGGTLNISGSGAVFLKNNSTHTVVNNGVHQKYDSSHIDNGKILQVSTNGWTSGFGAYLRPCTLSYSANQGTGSVPTSVTQHMGTTTTVGNNSGLSRASYTLGDWNTLSNGEGDSYAPGDDIVLLNDTITLYAEWNPIPVTGVTVSQSTATLILGDGNTSNNAVTLTATVSPEDAADKSVSWLSSDSTVASVSGGVVTAHKAGNVTITARTTDGSFEDTCSITVEQKVTGVTLSPSSQTLTLGDGNTSNNTVTLTATVSPDSADDKSVSWSSSDSSVASVSGGVVTAHKAGNVTITVTTDDGNHEDICAIKVEQKVTGVSLSSSSETLILGDGNTSNNTVTLTATVSPNNADDKSISWLSSDSSVASVSGGVVTAHKAGNVTITARTTDGGFEDTCAITVEQKVTGVSLSSSSETLTLGDVDTSNDTVTLIATISPDDATDKSVSWSSSDSSVASVSGGVVTAHKAGNVTITVRTNDGSFEDKCEIKVEQRVTGVTVLPEVQTLILGDGNPSNDSVILTATVSPDDADNKSIIWSCDNSIVAQVTPIDATTCEVSAKAVGDAIITVTTTDGSYQDTCHISVIDNTVYPGNNYGKLKGTLTGPGNVPQDGRFVKLYSTPATTITDPNGNFTFYNVQYSHHILVLKTQTGVEFDRYILDFVEGLSAGYSQSGNTITINYTRYTTDLQLVFNSDDTTSTLSDVVFTEVYIVPNPETGDTKNINYNLLAPILYVLIMMLIITLTVYVIRRYKLPVVVDEKNIDIK